MSDRHEERPPAAGETETVRDGADAAAGREAVDGADAVAERDGADAAAEPDSPAAASGRPPLSARDRAVLALEGESFTGPGAKERAVRERLGMSPTRYYQLLNALLDDPAAEAHAPVTVHRLRRVREARRAER